MKENLNEKLQDRCLDAFSGPCTDPPLQILSLSEFLCAAPVVPELRAAYFKHYAYALAEKISELSLSCDLPRVSEMEACGVSDGWTLVPYKWCESDDTVS